MNYRHAFHAGNHADVFKHAALALVLEQLLQKPQPFAVLDTHAGIGLYDLQADEVQRTREYEDGVGRIFGRELTSSPAYSRLIVELNPEGLRLYPGSPEIVRRMLRDGDRLVLCELHPEDAEALKARYRADRSVQVHRRDGYEAIGALLPPPERRGLVLIDPPFEAKDEAQVLVRALKAGLRKWPTGIFLVWYPVKDGRVGDLLSKAAMSVPFPKCLRVEFSPYAPDEASLPGSGLLVCNTPWKLDERLGGLCEELTGRLGHGRARWSLDWLTEP
jgi:23S rRNA (adenine2030-N6)-methyltransferase